MDRLQSEFMWRFHSIVLAILTALSFLLPFSTLLLPYRQEVQNNPEKYYAQIEEAFEAKNAAKLEALMCQSIKENEKNLTQKIEKAFDSVQGEIKSFDWEKSFSYTRSTNGFGGQIKNQDIYATIHTSQEDYYLYIDWNSANNMEPEETMIRAFNLKDQNHEPLVEIRASGV